MSLGIYLSIRTRFFQIRSIPLFFKTFFHFFSHSSKGHHGIHPLQTFCTTMAGMFGIGNIVGIVVALQVGGPGALFWVWIAAFFGSIIKYAEIFLSLKHRVPNNKGGYDGGAAFFLKSAFKSARIPLAATLLFCIYGADVYQFNVLTDCLTSSLCIPKLTGTLILLTLVLIGGISGMKRIAKICSFITPFFLLTYLAMGFWMLSQELTALPTIFLTVFKSAFQGHAAIGGFAGSSCLLALQHGIARVSYSSDIGIGYAGIIHSESSTLHPEKQAGLAVLGIFVDNLICTLSILIVLVSGLWKASPIINASELVQRSLSLYFPQTSFFMPIFLLIAGYTTLISYLAAGIKCSRFLSKKWGKKIYVLYSTGVFFLFSFAAESTALLVMSLSGALLLIINLIGILRLRDQISIFKDKDDSSFALISPPKINE